MCNKMLRTIYQKRQLFTKYILYRYKRRDYKDYIMAYQNGKVEAVNRTQAAESNVYKPMEFKPEQGALGATFGAIIKNIHEAVFGGVGFDMNVSEGYAQIMSNPNNAINIRGRTYYPHSNIGNLHPINSDGNSSSGCFSFYSMC